MKSTRPVRRWQPSLREPLWVRLGLTVIALGFLAMFVVLPVGSVFVAAFEEGIRPYLAAIFERDTLHAILLTVLTAAIAVPLNTMFGVAAAWLLSRYRFFGRGVLLALIDLPFSVSPVIAGLVFVLLFGSRGPFGTWLSAHDVKIVFAIPGVAIATTFVTFPLVAREVLAVMETQGQHEEEAALTLGASGWQIFWHVSLPKIRWALLYGILLCNARAVGEFGAVSVVSGHIRGQTNTLPLQVEILYNDYNFVGAFAAASLLALLALVTLVVKRFLLPAEQPT